jgi:phosphoglycolate phosphatase-like HAD superfamily hydrolase
MRLVIFDIDGTILLNGDVVRRLFWASFEEICGLPTPAERFSFAGMTDRGIFRRLLAGRPLQRDYEESFRRFAEHFCACLSRQYPTAEGPYVLPGVEALLSRLSETPNVGLALGTGNIRESAYIKLGRFGLDRFFPAGGFGGDHEDRSEVFRAGIEAASAHYGEPISAADVWVVGDTVSDIRAARAIGARVLAVSTGFARSEQLGDADVLRKDLAATGEVLAALLA